MKKMTLAGTTLALVLAAGSAVAAPATASVGGNGPSAGSFGINVPLASRTLSNGQGDFLLTGSYHVSKSIAVVAGFGLQMTDSGAATNNTATNIGLMGGARYYLKTDELAPFVGGRLQYASTKDGAATAYTMLTIAGELGAEYYLSKQFSLEGSAAFGYASSDAKAAGATTSVKSSVIGTTMINVSANFYF